MPGHWRTIKKKWNSHREISERGIKNQHKEVLPSKRRQTIGGSEAMNGRMSKSNSTLHSASIDSSPEHNSYVVGRRHYMRRPAVLINSDSFDNDQPSDQPKNATGTNFITVSLEDGNLSFKKTVPIRDNRTMEELLLAVLHKKGIQEESLPNYHLVACQSGVYSPVNLDALAMEYMASVIELKPLKSVMEKCNRKSSSPTENHVTVQSCLEYFEANGLIEIPLNMANEEDEPFHLPRVIPLDPIESSWEELDIHPHLKKSLNNKTAMQQQAIWELIATEHSFLRQLEIVINLFMRSLELIRRTGLLTEVNYHNVFGYMEEIYIAHEQFWYSALLPCLEKVRQEHCLLELNEIILRFPVEISADFDIYEQHCAFEKTNLRSLNEAMNQKDFKIYLEWCESQPQCQRLRLKDFLAKPMQRLTKYSLLLKAILGKTTDKGQIDELEQMIEDFSMFVNSVNGVLKAQEEVHRVEEVMKNIVGYNPVELTGEYKELVQPYLQLDLLAPMPDVDITRPRILIVEGKLRYRDNHTRTMVVHVFLFSDMLLITKTKGTDRYVIIRPPFKISQLEVVHKESGTIVCMVLNDYGVLADLFTLKTHSAEVAQEWTEHIVAAQDFYSSATKRKAQSWRILESLQQKRILHGISQDLIATESTLNGAHWSTQSISGSPVPSHAEFRRVPSCESTSSSVFPIETASTPRPERRLSSLRAASFDHPSPCSNNEHRLSFNIPNSRSTPPLESHRISFPFCNNSSNSPILNRPGWQRAQSLNTLMYSTDKQVLPDALNNSSKKKEPFQITMKDAMTQTDTDDDLTPRLSLEDDSTEDITTDEEYSPVLHSPIIPISIVVSPSTNGEQNRTHQRTQSLPKHLPIIDDQFDNPLTDYLSPTSPISPISNNGRGGERSSSLDHSPTDSSNGGYMVRHSSFDSHFQTKDESSKLSTTLPTGFRFPLNDVFRFKPLSKIHERDDEDSDDIASQEFSSYKKHFSRGSNLRRSKSNFELSRGPLLKPPSPLVTTHVRQNRERLDQILSYTNDRKLSPILSPKIMFNSSIEDDEEEEDIVKGNKGEGSHKADKVLLNDITKQIKDTKRSEEKKRPFWANKRIKSAGPSKSSKKGFFGLFKGKALSMENIVGHTSPDYISLSPPPKPKKLETKNHPKPFALVAPAKESHAHVHFLETTDQHNPNNIPLPASSPKKTSPILRTSPSHSVPEKKSPKSHSPKGVLRRQPALKSPTDPELIIGQHSTDYSKSDDQPYASSKPIRNSLQLTPPNHRVIFLSTQQPENRQRSVSAPSSPNIRVRHKSMKVFTCDEEPVVKNIL